MDGAGAYQLGRRRPTRPRVTQTRVNVNGRIEGERRPSGGSCGPGTTIGRADSGHQEH